MCWIIYAKYVGLLVCWCNLVVSEQSCDIKWWLFDILKKKETSVINLLHLSYFDCFLNIFYKFARKLRSDAVTLLFLAPLVEWSKVPLPMRKVWGPFHASLISIDKKFLQVKVARLPMVLILTHVKALMLLCLQRYKFFIYVSLANVWPLNCPGRLGGLGCAKLFFSVGCHTLKYWT